MYHRNSYIAVQKARDEHAQQMAYEKGGGGGGNHQSSSVQQNANFHMDESSTNLHHQNSSHQNGGEQMPTVRRLIHALRKFPQLYENGAVPATASSGHAQDGEKMDEIWAKVREIVEPANGSNVKNGEEQKGFHFIIK